MQFWCTWAANKGGFFEQQVTKFICLCLFKWHKSVWLAWTFSDLVMMVEAINKNSDVNYFIVTFDNFNNKLWIIPINEDKLHEKDDFSLIIEMQFSDLTMILLLIRNLLCKDWLKCMNIKSLSTDSLNYDRVMYKRWANIPSFSVYIHNCS